ncbi:hypothetical protein [Alteromonas sp. MB-3u-76]|uniref:hypothetical protein n=1 Tax=Alteromonas sp. MB-3u-76 TaxID=2058133 RepID=UPI0012FD201E|nr:hypothetical protein [Alteromonas sp. MB-3u-76]
MLVTTLWLPVRNSTLKHKTGLTEYRASRYFARLPSCLAESGSLALCTSNFLWLASGRPPETLPLANNALAIRIIFPSVRVIQVSFNLTGLPASLGKQKSRPSKKGGFVYFLYSAICLLKSTKLFYLKLMVNT